MKKKKDPPRLCNLKGKISIFKRMSTRAKFLTIQAEGQPKQKAR
jgi:hypothetical protein